MASPQDYLDGRYADRSIGELGAMQVVALSQLAGTTAAEALEEAACFICLSSQERMAAETQLLIEILLATDQEADVTLQPCFKCLPVGNLYVIKTTALAGLADGGTIPSPDSLLAEIGCVVCHTASELGAIRLKLLADILVGLDGGADVTAQGILTRARCLICLPPGDLMALQAVAAAGLTQTEAVGAITDEAGNPLTTEDGLVLTI